MPRPCAPRLLDGDPYASRSKWDHTRRSAQVSKNCGCRALSGRECARGGLWRRDMGLRSGVDRPPQPLQHPAVSPRPLLWRAVLLRAPPPPRLVVRDRRDFSRTHPRLRGRLHWRRPGLSLADRSHVRCWGFPLRVGGGVGAACLPSSASPATMRERSPVVGAHRRAPFGRTSGDTLPISDLRGACLRQCRPRPHCHEAAEDLVRCVGARPDPRSRSVPLL